MNNCTNCANAVFDPVWGEYKCKVRTTRIYDVDGYLDCPDHEKSNNTEVTQIE